MNTGVWIAVLLLVAIAGAHSILGERYILVRLFRRGPLPKLFGSDWFTRRTLRFAWHLTSIAWLGFAALLAYAAGGEGLGVAQLRSVVAITFLLTAAVTAIASHGRHFAWPVFLAIAALVWLTL